MGVGFIQLIFSGNDKILFNNNPHITFFKIYYRRHTNFYINNYIVQGNINNKNKLISYEIPHGGDLLSHNYLEINYPDNYFEICFDYKNLYNTLNTKILNFFDSYSVKVNSYIKQDIEEMTKFKFNFQYNSKIYFVFFCDYQISHEYLNSIKYGQNISIETDKQGYYFNINQFYSYFSFIYKNIECTNLNQISYFNKVFEKINFNKILFLRVDNKFNNTSFKIFRNNFTVDFIENLVNEFISIVDCNSNNMYEMGIFNESIYISFNSQTLQNTISSYIKDNNEIVKIEIIKDKIIPYNLTIKKTNNENEFDSKINDIFIVTRNYIVYYEIYVDGSKESQVNITMMKNNSFLGNLSNIDFNNYLIQKETEFVSLSNLQTYTNNSLLFFISLVINLTCQFLPTTIENFLRITNNNYNYFKTVKYYEKKIDEFNQKILNKIVLKKNLILNNISLSKILYSYSINKLYNNFQVNTTLPFTNQQITDFTQILNYYFVQNFIDKFGSGCSKINDNVIAVETILMNEFQNNTIDNLSIQKYSSFLENNYLYDNQNTKEYTLQDYNSLIVNNYLQYTLVNSYIIIDSIIKKQSKFIYQKNGDHTSLLANSTLITNLFPISGLLFLEEQLEESSKYGQFNFTINLNDYLNNFINSINLLYQHNYFKYKINVSEQKTLLISETKSYEKLSLYINKFYEDYVNFFQIIDYITLSEFSNFIVSTYIGDSSFVNKEIISNIYSYTNKFLFNNAFDNIYLKEDYSKITKFLFLEGSPMYRIYYSLVLYQQFVKDYQTTTDINILRKFTESFLLTYLYYFNKNEIYQQTNNENFFMDRIINEIYKISNVFCCYGDITFLQDNKFIELLKIIPGMNIYSSYYLSKFFISDFLNYQSNISDIFNKFKYNFDDLIIALYINTLNDNKRYFNNYEAINDFVNLLFDKNTFNSSNILTFLTNFINGSQTKFSIDTSSKNNIYYNGYYSIFNLGTLFDNIDYLNLSTTNEIFSLFKQSTNNIELFNKQMIRTPSPIQYTNIFSSNNIAKIFDDFRSPMFSLFQSNNSSSITLLYNNLVNFANSILESYGYIKIFLLTKFDFEKIIAEITKVIDHYNSINMITNSNQNDSQTIKMKIYFKNYSLYAIFLYFRYFIVNYIKFDINNFTSQNNFNTFDEYIINKYSHNIYYSLIVTLEKNFRNNDLININYFYNIIDTTENEDVKNLNSKKNLKNKFDSDNFLNRIIYDDYYQENNQILENNFNKSFDLNLKNELIDISNKIYCDVNKIYFTSYQNINFKITNSFSINSDLKNIFSIFKNGYYITGINSLKNIYTSLNNIYITYSIRDSFSRNIINLSFSALLKFINDDINYYQLLYFKNVIYSYPKNQNRYNINSDSFTAGELQNFFNNFNSISSPISETYSNILQQNIQNSFYFENNINTIIYLLSTDLLNKKNDFTLSQKKYLSSNTLYNITKLFKFISIIDIPGYSTSKTIKTYFENTSLYSNQESFLLFNYENLIDEVALIQNFKIVEILSDINIEYGNKNNPLPNTYYFYLKQFLNFCKEQKINRLLELKLSSNITLFEYFLYFDCDGIQREINDYVNLNDYYSPRQIFNDIINFKQSNEYDPELIIDTDKIKIKMFIFLYFNFIILKKLPDFLENEFLNNIKNIQDHLEFNIEGQLFDLSVHQVLNSYKEVISFSIKYIYSFEQNSKILDVFFKDKLINENIKNNIKQIISITKSKVNILGIFSYLNELFYESYYQIVETNTDYQNGLYCNYEQKYNLLNLVQDINSIISYDKNVSNSNKYSISIFLYNEFNIGIKNKSTLEENKVSGSFISQNIANFLTYLNKTNISDFNITYIFITTILKYYSIYYQGEIDQINTPLFYLKLGNNVTQNDLYNQKGLYQSTIQVNNYYGNNVFESYTRINNIFKNYYIFEKTKNLNTITPTSFDESINFMNYNFNYKFRLNKLYGDKYNYYNYQNNYIKIYQTLKKYFSTLLKNNKSISNLKNYPFYYENVFHELFSSYISEIVDFSSLEQISTFNNLVNIYKSYNLKLTNTYEPYLQQNSQFTNYSELYQYIINIYFYQLFNVNYFNQNITGTYFQDFFNFFNEINQDQNINLEYNNVYYNILFKLFVLQILIVKLINHQFNKNFQINYSQIKNNYQTLINDLTLGNKFVVYLNKYFNETKVDFFVFNNGTYTQLYSTLNLTNPTFFKLRIANYIQRFIFYSGNMSQENYLSQLYSEYFENISFDYYIYSTNDLIVETVIYTQNFIENIVKSYLEYYFSTEINLKNIKNTLLLYFESVLISDKNFEYYKFIEKVFFNTQDELKREIIFDKIIDSLLNKYWGFSFINKYKVIKNDIYRSSLLIFNIYYFALNSYNNNNNLQNNLNDIDSINNETSTNQVNYFQYINKLSSLNILFDLIQKIIPFIYIHQEIYKKIIIYYLVGVNTFLDYKNNLIFSLDPRKLIASKLDYLNSNILENNIINNYYKNVQLDTIKEISNYKVFPINYTEYTNDNLTRNIYYSIAKNLNLTYENNLGINMYTNTVVGLINNYLPKITLYKTNYEFINSIFDTIYDNINFLTSSIDFLFGGSENNSFKSNIYGIFFDKDNYKNDKKIATIFTNIYANIKKESNGNLLVILLYYLILTVWSMTEVDYFSYSLQKYLYLFSNLINKEIIQFIQNNTTSQLFTEINLLLSFNGDNYSFIELSNNIFNSLLLSTQTKTNMTQNLINYKYKTDGFVDKDNQNSDNINSTNINNFNELFDFTFQNTSQVKIFKWTYFMGLIYDFNKSEIIKIIKSINDSQFIKIQEAYFDNIIKLIGGQYYDNYGILNTIDNIQLIFDDQMIDKITQEQYKIFYNLLQVKQKKDLIKKMFGIENHNVSKSLIRPYLKKFNENTYYLPVKFFYNNYQNVIPLISAMYTKMKLKFYLTNNTVFKNNLLTTLITSNQKKYNLDIDFILIEKDERIKKTKYKIDNLVNLHSYFTSTIQKNIFDIISSATNEEISISFNYEIYNLCERMIWTLEIYLDDNNIINLLDDDNNLNITNNNNDEVNTNSQFKYHSNYYKDIIRQVKLYMDDTLLSSVNNLSTKNYNKVTSLMNLYKYTIAPTLNKKYYCNSFSLEPDIFQPTGCLNMSMFKYFTIKVIFDDTKLKNLLGSLNLLYNYKQVKFVMKLSLNEYNILRYQSGLSGMLFIK